MFYLAEVAHEVVAVVGLAGTVELTGEEQEKPKGILRGEAKVKELKEGKGKPYGYWR